MKEKKEVKTFIVDFKCPKCKIGYMRKTGKCFSSNPPKYDHACNNPDCDYKEKFVETYPYIDYDEV